MDEDLQMGACNFLYSGFEDMLLDEDRNSKYRSAIQSAVQQKLKNNEEAHVLDIGSGTGLLSLYSAAAGATSVTAIELDPVVYNVSLRIAKQAGFADRIKFINAESLEIDSLPQKANIFVSEIVDSELLGENIIRTVRHALENLTTEDVICIPARADIFVVPVESRLLANQVRLPEIFASECNGNFYGIDSHWLTSGRKTLDFACRPFKLKSFVLNDLNSLTFQGTTTLDFTVNSSVKQIDGVLLWWDLDLDGSGQFVISSGAERDGPRWRNHWLEVAYGFAQPILVQSNDKLQLRGSHDEVSFWFDIQQSKFNETFAERQDCLCQWHFTISPNTFLRWNTVYNQSEFVQQVIKSTLNKTVLCIGSHSLLPTLLKAKKVILIEEDERFCSKISAHCSSKVQFLNSFDDVDCWNEIEFAVFDTHSNELSSPAEFASNYFYVVNNYKNIKILPEKLELKATPMKFENLWRRKMRVTKIDEFDYSAFDECFSGNSRTGDDDLELLPLWEERCFVNGPETVLFPCTGFTKIDLQIPRETDAFVFWFSSTTGTNTHCPFRRLGENEIEWDKGTRQWLHFLTNPKSTKLRVEFDCEFDECLNFTLDPNNPNDETKRFTFDHSYWSHSGYKSQNGYFAPTNSKYADQKKVFNELGKGVLDNAWKGYNCSLFAYGQTGSGKSYSIVGFGKNKGIVPMVCEELFRRIDENKENKESKKGQTEYQVSISMLEIYREKIRDLLSTKPPPNGGLKLRENPKTGFYVEGLSSSPVSSYKEIEQKINEGTKTRTIAATKMNSTSSRAHTIVKIQFVQKIPKSEGNGTTTKTSEINLVDLAGSERQKDAESEGDRLKEGIIINQSLTTLGRIPYRDSVLTSLLKNALGGNSKTIMIAAISPADINYEETLSTLRFADRAKSIKTQAVVNESATEKMIRELKEENEKATNNDQKRKSSKHSDDSCKKTKRQWRIWKRVGKQRLAEERKKFGGEDRTQIDARRKNDPHLWNLNEDPALTDMLIYFIEDGENRIGNGQSQSTTNIVLKGLSILPDHALIKNKESKKFTLVPLKATEILVNGKQITGEYILNQNDRILFGGNSLFVFANPKKGGVKTSQEITYDLAQKEIAKSVGITNSLSRGKRSPADAILEDELVNLLPNVYRANAMAKELKRNVNFEIVLMAPEIRGNADGLPEILIRVNNRSDDTTFLWSKSDFFNRYYGMQEMYQNYIENDPQWNVTKDKDPFVESPESSIDVGTVTVFLRSLAYLVEQDEQYPILDVQGTETGQLSVALTPCNSNGKEILGEFVDDPKELIGKNLGFKVKILAATGLPRRLDEKPSAKKQNSTNAGSKSATARSQSSTKEKQPNGVDRRRRSISAKKDSSGALKSAENGSAKTKKRDSSVSKTKSKSASANGAAKPRARSGSAKKRKKSVKRSAA
ncbi:Kinesin-like protein [Aphelenchoides bicaudatus]|nr:Kinesin-like protein [Aphelenchoides bicaudatus]